MELVDPGCLAADVMHNILSELASLYFILRTTNKILKVEYGSNLTWITNSKICRSSSPVPNMVKLVVGKGTNPSLWQELNKTILR